MTITDITNSTTTTVPDYPDRNVETQIPGATTVQAVTGTAARVALTGTGKYRLYQSTAISYYLLGNSTVTATATTGTPLPFNTIEVIATGSATHISVIGSSGNLYITNLG